MATQTLNDHQVTKVSAASEAQFRFVKLFGVHGEQLLERTFAKPASVIGAGARRAVRDRGDALEKLAE